MFHSGLSELILIFLVAIIVLGPKRLPEAATQLGSLMYKLKKLWQNIAKSFDETPKTENDDNNNTPS